MTIDATSIVQLKDFYYNIGMAIQQEMTARPLSEIKMRPNILIPDRFLKLSSDPSKIVAVPFSRWIGRIDQEYIPDLMVLIAEKNGFSSPIQFQEDEDRWGSLLDRDRQQAIKEGSLTEKDRALLSFWAIKQSPLGVQMDMIVLQKSLRGLGLGKAFYESFAQVLKEMGYKYICGRTNSALKFLRATGHYTSSELQQVLPFDVHRFFDVHILNYWSKDGYTTTIRFFDPQLEKECVRPEFIKSS